MIRASSISMEAVSVSFLLSILVIIGTPTCTTECLMEDGKCEFWLEIGARPSMMIGNKPVYSHAGKLYTYDVINTTLEGALNEDDVISVDGRTVPQIVFVVNNSMPAPPLEVYEGQTIIVHVKNGLNDQVTSVHWHGMRQEGTPWMDGVGGITQCGIQPSQTFTYKFKAEPKGTTFYHAHVFMQASYGIVGSLIIRERTSPSYGEKILLFQDWSHVHMVKHYYDMTFGSYSNGVQTLGELVSDRSGVGAVYNSGLINGKGRFYDQITGTKTEAPLTLVNVETRRQYRFRFIGAGFYFSFRVSIDNHTMLVVAADFHSVVNTTVESLILSPGERYDVIVTTDQPTTNYWIRGRLMTANNQSDTTAILHYQGASDNEPITMPKDCSSNDTCYVFACPFPRFPDEPNIECVTFNDIKATERVDPSILDTTNLKEHFLNFGFLGKNSGPPSINAIRFARPDVPPLTHNQVEVTTCKAEDCGLNKACFCTHVIDIQSGDVIQLVLTNFGDGRRTAHPIHLHGYQFYVMKVGFGRFNASSGWFIEDGDDVYCEPNATGYTVCNLATWKNSSWGNGNIPDMELDWPPRKDTLVVPPGSYVVVRFKADHAGMWSIHCHMEPHLAGGMFMLLNESYSDVPPPPKGFPECYSFFDTDDETVTLTSYPSTETVTSDPPTETPVLMPSSQKYEASTFWAVVGCLVAAVVIELFVIVRQDIGYRRQDSAKATVSGADNIALS